MKTRFAFAALVLCYYVYSQAIFAYCILVFVPFCYLYSNTQQTSVGKIAMECEGCSCCTRHVQHVADIHDRHAHTLNEMQERIVELTQKYKQTTTSIIHAQIESEKSRETGHAAVEMLRRYASQIGMEEPKQGFDLNSINKKLQDLIQENRLLTEKVAQSHELAQKEEVEHQTIVRDLQSQVVRLQ